MVELVKHDSAPCINYAVPSSKGEVLQRVLHSEDEALICLSVGIGEGRGEMLSSNNATQDFLLV